MSNKKEVVADNNSKSPLWLLRGRRPANESQEGIGSSDEENLLSKIQPGRTRLHE